MSEPEFLDNNLREHSFDGIQEFDNHLPRWWLWSFYLACIFSVVYWIFYHGGPFGASPTAQFEAVWGERLAKEAATKPVSAAMLIEFSKQSRLVAEGETVFKTTCAACHLPDGSGLVGPNLTDNHWILGAAPDDIYKTVTKGGREGKGMMAWQPQIGKEKCQAVVAYMLAKLVGTNRPGKGPEGEETKR